MHCRTGSRDHVPDLQPSPRSHLHLQSPPCPLGQHLSEAPTNTSEQPAVPAGVFPPLTPTPSHRPGPEGGCPAGAATPAAEVEEVEENSAQLLATQRTPFPRSPPAGLGLTAAGLLRAARRGAVRCGAVRCGGQRPSAGARSRRALPARGSRARFRGGARAGRRGGGGGSGPAPAGKFLPARPPPPEPRRGYPRRQPRPPPPGSTWQRCGQSPPPPPTPSRGRALPGANVLRPPHPGGIPLPPVARGHPGGQRCPPARATGRLTARAARCPGVGSLAVQPRGFESTARGWEVSGESRKLGTGYPGGQRPEGPFFREPAPHLCK